MHLISRLLGIVLLAGMIASPLAARADGLAIAGKWGPPDVEEACSANYILITAEGTITVALNGETKTGITYTIEGDEMVVRNAGQIERTKFQVDGDTLILNPGADNEVRFTRCKA